MTDKINDHLTILLYHGVTNSRPHPIRNYSGKHINNILFEKQIKFISENYNILSMDDVACHIKQGSVWPKDSVAVTFDDGFENNFLNAIPILEKYRVPTIFYVCSGMVETEMMFWVDKIEDCIVRTQRNEIKLETMGEKIFYLESNQDKVKTIDLIKKHCKGVDSAKKNEIVSELIVATNIEPSSSSCNDYKMMNWSQLKKIAVNDLFTIGGHTLYHDIMSAQPIERLKIDISGCLSLLDYNLQQETKHFAYPEGQNEHFNDEIKELLRSFGIQTCPSAIHGVNRHEDPFNLKRIMPGFMGTKFPLGSIG